MKDATQPLQEAVASVMARVAAGDPDARWELFGLSEPSLLGLFRSEARRVGEWLSDDDLFDLTLDAVDALVSLAGSWKPGRALPWVWARQRMRHLVHQHIGQFTRPLDELAEAEAPPVASATVEDPAAVLHRLAERHEGAAELVRRLERVNPRDADIYLRYRLEQGEGSQAPAVTVGADHGMQPAAVRKVVQRVARRIAPDDFASAA